MGILFNPGDVVVIDFPGVTGVKRRPTVVSSPVYHASRPDLVVGLITSHATALGPTDYALQDWAQAGLRVSSVFRSFFATLPPATHPVLVGHLSDRDWQGVCTCIRICVLSASVQNFCSFSPFLSHCQFAECDVLNRGKTPDRSMSGSNS
jgi:mRNA interferase MazF